MEMESEEQTYTTTTNTYIGHFKASDVNFVTLCDLFAGNVLNTADNNALYIPLDLQRETSIGIKFEMVNSEENIFESTYTIDIKVVDDDIL